MKNIKSIIKNKKIIILIPLVILFTILIINSGNIYNLLKGNTWTISNVDLKEGELSAQIHDDNGYVFFENGNGAKLSLDKNTKNPKIYDVKVRLKFTNNKANKKAVIKLKEGINLESDGSAGLGSEKLENKEVKNSEPIKTYCTTPKDESVTECEYKTNNKIITYHFNENLSEITITLQISPDQALDYSSIEDAIIIELYQNEEMKSTKSIDVNEDFSANPIIISGGSQGNNAVATDLDAKEHDKYYNVKNYNTYDNILGLYSYQTKARKILYEYIEFVVKAPNTAALSGTYLRKTTVGTSGFSYKYDSETYAYEDKSTEKISSVSKIDCKNPDKNYTDYCAKNYNGDNNYNSANYNLYVFKVNNIYTHFYGVIPIWRFDTKTLNSTVYINAVNISYKTYGGKKQNIKLTTDVNKNINKFKINNDVELSYKDISFDLKSYNNNNKNQDVTLGYYGFQNLSPIALDGAKVTIDFDKNIGITSIVLPDKKTISNVVVYTNKSNKIPVTLNHDNIVDNTFNLKRYLLIKDEIAKIGLDEYITKIEFEWTIPAYHRQTDSWFSSYTGIITNESSLKKNENKITTEIKVEKEVKKEVKVYADFNSIGTIDFNNSILKVYPKINEVNSNLVTGAVDLNAGEKSHFKVDIEESNNNEAYIQRILYNPIIYIRSETGLDVTNISLVNSDGVNLCEKINCNVNPTINNKKEKIYKIDTSSITDGSAKVGYIGNRDGNTLRTLTLEFDIDIPIGFSDESKKHNFSDMIYVTSKESNEIHEYNTHKHYTKVENKEIFEELSSDETVMTSASTNSYYKVVSDVDLISKIEQKNKNGEFISWSSDLDDSSINENNELNLKLQVLNNTGYNFPHNDKSDEVATIYIPIPKKGQNLYNLSNDSSFNFSLDLSSITSKLENGTGSYKISYAKVIPKEYLNENNKKTIDLDELYKTSNWSDTLLEEHNFIKIEFDKLEKDSLISFYINYKLSGSKTDYNEIKSQHFNYIMYKNVTTTNGKLTITKIGNYVGVTNELSKYKLLVIHKDIYDVILDTESSILNYGAKYETSKKEFENYEIFLEPPNKLYPEEPNGILLKDTTVTYVYKSTELRKVIVHYIDEDTNERLFDDVELNGKDLEEFKTEYKTINGYNLSKIIKDGETAKPDDNIVKGSYTKDVQEITYYYKKIPIVSTLDNITTYIILFTISLVGIITFIVYKLKSKKDN